MKGHIQGTYKDIVAAMFKIEKKSLTAPSRKPLNKLLYIHTMKFHSAIKNI